MKNGTFNAADTLYLIYDGDCFLCRNTAQAIKIKKSVGHLQIINARMSHPLVIEAAKNGYDLNEGILVKYHNKYYFGSDALHFLALIGSPSNLFNKINSFLFKSAWLSAFLYPFLKSVRSAILFMQGIPPIANIAQEPLIKLIYGESAAKLPIVLQKRYANRPYSQDYLLMKGEMNIYISKTFKLLSPLFKLAGALVAYPADKIPVDVELTSDPKSNAIVMHRTFYYKDRPPYHFSSRVIHIKDNVVIELMHFGFASRLIYLVDKDKIIMDYGGYVFRLGKWLIPIPLGFIVGKFYSFEAAESDDTFSMEVKMVHPLIGKIFQYDGHFKIVSSHE